MWVCVFVISLAEVVSLRQSERQKGAFSQSVSGRWRLEGEEGEEEEEEEVMSTGGENQTIRQVKGKGNYQRTKKWRQTF